MTPKCKVLWSFAQEIFRCCGTVLKFVGEQKQIMNSSGYYWVEEIKSVCRNLGYNSEDKIRYANSNAYVQKT